MLQVMSRVIASRQPTTISREFAARLDHLDSSKNIRAVVMLRSVNSPASSTRGTRGQRAGLVRKVREGAAAALPSIDRILKLYHGKRLSEDVGVLGNIVIEATPDGIRALAASEHVKAVLEDQHILQLVNP